MSPSQACPGCGRRDPLLSASYPTITWYSGSASARVRETGHRTGFPRTAAQSPRRTAINRLLDSAHRKHLAPAPNIFHAPISPRPSPDPRHGPPAHLGRASSPRTPHARKGTRKLFRSLRALENSEPSRFRFPPLCTRGNPGALNATRPARGGPKRHEEVVR